jgi:hypothetical protein
MSADRVAQIRARLDAAGEDWQNVEFMTQMCHLNNQERHGSYPPEDIEFLGHAGDDLAYLLAENAKLVALLEADPTRTEQLP